MNPQLLERMTRSAYRVGMQAARKANGGVAYRGHWNTRPEAVKAGWRAAIAWTVKHSSGLQGGTQ